MWISIEGNVAVGKTSILKELKSIASDKFSFIEEPIHLYSNYKDFNPLSLSYTEPVLNSAITQLHIIENSFDWYSKIFSKYGHGLCISERCPFSSLIFIQHYLNLGQMSHFAAKFLKDKVTELSSMRPWLSPDLIIYLSASPDVCFQRSQIRARDEEASVSKTMFHSVHECHEKLFKPKHNVIVVDANNSFRNVAKAVYHYIVQWIDQNLDKKTMTHTCNWCGCFIDSKYYCADCKKSCQQECITCHKPYPSLKYFQLNKNRCNSCHKRHQKQCLKRKHAKS